ncbi:methyltransferase [Candidatus Entotheonella palauensis]|uniref:Methyltransferase n=1 Tax=Candidatus Entotheonella gemina TaxID=1429439 RepID=W4M9W2_9BACT|nr:methyltransferase [Candidatus Entotheonella palauensis]ETX06407.1 MAG: hypothetical protein ETSY2_17305 [Candidatus Entotheonella gemina]
MAIVQLEPGSFRDRHGRIVYYQHKVLRCLSESATSHWTALKSKRFFQDAVAHGHVVATTEVEADAQSLALPDAEYWHTILEHERIPLISYPYEWSFGMLKDAALLQLQLIEDALGEGMILKDATAYNVQWRGAQPVFIDIPSFEVLEPGSAWVGYRQFCQLFLFPLMLQAYRQVPFQPLLRGMVDGISVDMANQLFSWRDRLRAGVLAHVYLQAKMQSRYGATQRNIRNDLKSAGFSLELIRSNIRRLKRLVEKLTWRSSASEWGDYNAMHNYSEEDHRLKGEFVERIVKDRDYTLVWDIGANTGQFSRIASQHADYVIAADMDPLAVERHYQQLRQAGCGNILPIVMNLADPSPALGWRLQERRPLDDRGRPNLILCLALIHHIVITANIPLREFIDWLAQLGADVVIEFVSRDDEMVKTLLRNKEDQYHDYDLNYFEKCLTASYEIITKQILRSGNRTLYLARPMGRGETVQAI